MQPLDREFVLTSLRNLDNPRLVLRPEETPTPERIPAGWWPLLSLHGVDLAGLAQLWGPLPEVLPEMWRQLTRTLRGLVVLLEDGHPPTLLYLYSGGERLFHHRGQPPIVRGHVPARLSEMWPNWPPAARSLYEVHNGWTALFSQSMGHLPVGKIETAYDLVGAEVEDPRALPLDLTHTTLVYSNGAGSYLCLETPADDDARAFVWTAGRPAEVGLQAPFTAIYDAWTAIHFEEMDSAAGSA